MFAKATNYRRRKLLKVREWFLRQFVCPWVRLWSDLDLHCLDRRVRQACRERKGRVGERCIIFLFQMTIVVCANHLEPLMIMNEEGNEYGGECLGVLMG